MLACNLFRTNTHELYCAAPEDRPVPPFIDGRAWAFAGKLGEGGIARLPTAVVAAIRCDGFYIFKRLGEADGLVAALARLETTCCREAA